MVRFFTASLLLLMLTACTGAPTNESAAVAETAIPTPTPIPATATATSLPPTATNSPTPTTTNSPTATATKVPTPTITPTPTLDLSRCNATGCGSEAAGLLPTAVYDSKLLLRQSALEPLECADCPANPRMAPDELQRLLNTPPDAFARLRDIALSQNSYEIAPGLVYIFFKNTHHVVVDLKASDFVLRNIIPEGQRGQLITPSYCLSPDSLIVTDADYHGLNSSNKTEMGQDMFFHLGRAALFERDGRYDIDVIRERPDYDRTRVSWGAGPIFIWDGQFDYNPEQEWFEPQDLDYYLNTTWTKISVALSQNRQYLFITVSDGLTLEEHAQNILELSQTWGIKIDRAMRFDSGESTFLAIRLGQQLVPVLDLPEPLIVNCFAIERAN